MIAKFNYPRAIATADRLIQKFGMDAVLRRAGANPTDRPCRVAITEFKPRDNPAALANPIDRQVFMSTLNAAGTLTPEPDNEQDQLVTFVQPLTNPPVEDEVLSLTCKPKRLAPAGANVVWEFTVRR